ncbi:hypothetical protein PR048_024035 [Dryococelus australis]|uniref:Uncharacterized protein n=1 Tax=Dryococelus australis TaxID=614101 RepID=A0ABQ9GVV3_9NEOP|nr:hypothetical protein PR048_024035 [Dryococelus australis]
MEDLVRKETLPKASRQNGGRTSVVSTKQICVQIEIAVNLRGTQLLLGRSSSAETAAKINGRSRLLFDVLSRRMNTFPHCTPDNDRDRLAGEERLSFFFFCFHVSGISRQKIVQCFLPALTSLAGEAIRSILLKIGQPRHCEVLLAIVLFCLDTCTSFPTKANQTQYPTRSLPDFRIWESCRTMALVGGFSRESLVSPALPFRRCSMLTSVALTGSQDPAVKSRPDIFTHLRVVDFILLRGDFNSPGSRTAGRKHPGSATCPKKGRGGLRGGGGRPRPLWTTASSCRGAMLLVALHGASLPNGPATPQSEQASERASGDPVLTARSSLCAERDSISQVARDKWTLDSIVMSILEPQMFVHWLLPQRVASVTPHLAVWHTLLVSLQLCYWLRVVQVSLAMTSRIAVPNVYRERMRLRVRVFVYECADTRAIFVLRHKCAIATKRKPLNWRAVFRRTACTYWTFCADRIILLAITLLQNDIKRLQEDYKFTQLQFRNYRMYLLVYGRLCWVTLDISSPTKAHQIRLLAGSLPVFTRGNRAGRCHGSAGFLGDLPFSPPLHSGAVPYPTCITLIGSQDLNWHVAVKETLDEYFLGKKEKTFNNCRHSRKISHGMSRLPDKHIFIDTSTYTFLLRVRNETFSGADTAAIATFKVDISTESETASANENRDAHDISPRRAARRMCDVASHER